MDAVGKIELSNDEDVVAAAVVDWLEVTGTTDMTTVPSLVLAATVALVDDKAAGLFAQGIVTYTVCVTVSGRRLMVCVGAAPCAYIVVVRKEKGRLGQVC